MRSRLYNLARMTTATTGTGAMTLGSAVAGFLSFAAAGVQNGDKVTYAIIDGTESEIGRGTYTASGTTLSRSVLRSTNSNNAIALSGSAEVFITAAGEDFLQGTDTNDNASAGHIGEILAAVSAGVSLTSTVVANVTSVALTAGDWDVSAQINLDPASGAVMTAFIGMVSPTSASLTGLGDADKPGVQFALTFPANSNQYFPMGTGRISLSAPATIYLVAYSAFSPGTVTATGWITARRAR